jgi:hypothetical protein
MACGAIPESLSRSLRLNAEIRSAAAHEKRKPSQPLFLKNNINSRPACQEIVDFS